MAPGHKHHPSHPGTACPWQDLTGAWNTPFVPSAESQGSAKGRNQEASTERPRGAEPRAP